MDEIVYLGLGGNIGDSLSVLKKSLALIAEIPEIIDMEISSFYETAPVSDIPQRDYLNAVCRFNTSLSAQQLFEKLQAIERMLGKLPKAKDLPRVIDIDILFFGKQSVSDKDLEIPHPRWQERLFVIVPLLDLTAEITVPQKGHNEKIIDLKKLKDSHPSTHAITRFKNEEKCNKSL